MKTILSFGLCEITVFASKSQNTMHSLVFFVSFFFLNEIKFQSPNQSLDASFMSESHEVAALTRENISTVIKVALVWILEGVGARDKA